MEGGAGGVASHQENQCSQGKKRVLFRPISYQFSRIKYINTAYIEKREGMQLHTV